MKKIFILSLMFCLALLGSGAQFKGISMATRLSPYIVAQWNMNDNTASTTVVDETGDHNGDFNDATGDPNTDAHTITGKINTALDFDGTDDFINVGNSLDIGTGVNPFSVSVWIKIDQLPSSDNHDFINRYQDHSNRQWSLYQARTDKKVKFTIYNDPLSQYGITSSTSALVPDTWYHLVGTYDGSVVYLYINTTQNDFAQCAVGAADLDLDVTIGGSPAINDYMDGTLDNIMIFNKELTQTEITYLYNSGDGRE